MDEGTQVRWDRDDLPDGEGIVVEVKDTGMHMVREANGNVHAFPEHQVGTVLKVKDGLALPR